MSTQDTCCTLVPYFMVPHENLPAFQQLCERLVAKAQSEPQCLYYGFSFSGETAHCREGYENAEGLLAHLDNISILLEEAVKMAYMVRLEIHGPEKELDKLRAPLAHLSPQFFTLTYGFRR